MLVISHYRLMTGQTKDVGLNSKYKYQTFS